MTQTKRPYPYMQGTRLVSTEDILRISRVRPAAEQEIALRMLTRTAFHMTELVAALSRGVESEVNRKLLEEAVQDARTVIQSVGVKSHA